MATNRQMGQGLAIEGDNNNLLPLLRGTEDVHIHHNIILVVDTHTAIINTMIIIIFMVIRDTRIDKVGTICLLIFVYNLCTLNLCVIKYAVC